MEFLKKRTNAWLITLIIIILATVISSGSSLNKLRLEAENVFYIGEDMDGIGIQHDLEMIMSDCSNLTVVAGRYMDKEHELIKAVLKARDTLGAAKTPGKKYREAQNLLQSAVELYTYIGDLPLSQKDQDFRRSLYTNMKSHNIIISRSTYNQHAREFNNILSRFPANILSAVSFISPLELYE
ncbi:MAG TPA: LemA family protein [Clostridiales bacterium]|nr:LemA family protein [Clostridiales bacterium]